MPVEVINDDNELVIGQNITEIELDSNTEITLDNNLTEVSVVSSPELVVDSPTVDITVQSANVELSVDNQSSFEVISEPEIQTLDVDFSSLERYDWMSLVRGYKIPPVFLETITEGKVYQYTYRTSGADINLYRVIGNSDKFYTSFLSSVPSGHLATKEIIL